MAFMMLTLPKLSLPCQTHHKIPGAVSDPWLVLR